MLSQLFSLPFTTISTIMNNPMVEVLPEMSESATLPPKAPQKSEPESGYLTPISTPPSSRRDSFFSSPISPKPTLQLLDLPTDLLLLLSDHLPSPSLLSLRLTCKPLHTLLPRPPKPSDAAICALQASARHLASSADASESRARCALCKSLYPLSLFKRAGILSPALPFRNFTGYSVPGIPESEENDTAIATGQSLSHISDTAAEVQEPRICAWHINRFVFPPTAALAPDAMFDALVSAAGRAEGRELEGVMVKVSEGGWASSVESCCMHCGCIVVCVCSVGGCGVCKCDCDGCGTREVRCWWKLARKGYGPRHEGSFGVARGKWLVARAEEAERFGWDGRTLRAEGMVDWGMVRVVKCATAGRQKVAEGRKRKAEVD
ncbi:Hypothetical protein D9617_7g029930 [Elsinoe fawcettii]|nr:Hypothetical protein D9617_7g029930 [Elsinoe fawcettii]